MKATASWMFAAPGQNSDEYRQTGHAVSCVGGGTGIAAMPPYSKGAQKAGNRAVATVGARSKDDLLLLKTRLKALRTEVLVSTDDGSYTATRVLFTELLEARLKSDKDVKEVVAVGPVPMMDAVNKCTRPFEVLSTTVSFLLNPIMVDGIGVCAGACRGKRRAARPGSPAMWTARNLTATRSILPNCAAVSALYRKQEEVSFEKAQSGGCRQWKIRNRPKDCGTCSRCPCQPPLERAHNFMEVALGYTGEMAMKEALTLLRNAKSPNVSAAVLLKCRSGISSKQVADGNLAEAYKIINSTNSLPAVCGRVSPAEENQCEGTNACFWPKASQLRHRTPGTLCRR